MFCGVWPNILQDQMINDDCCCQLTKNANIQRLTGSFIIHSKPNKYKLKCFKNTNHFPGKQKTATSKDGIKRLQPTPTSLPRAWKP